jgi:hypothetical protein
LGDGLGKDTYLSEAGWQMDRRAIFYWDIVDIVIIIPNTSLDPKE